MSCEQKYNTIMWHICLHSHTCCNMFIILPCNTYLLLVKAYLLAAYPIEISSKYKNFSIMHNPEKCLKIEITHKFREIVCCTTECATSEELLAKTSVNIISYVSGK